MPLPPPIALTPCLPTELLSFILQQTRPTTLIICGSRTAFLSALHDATSLPPPPLPPDPQSPQDPDPDPDPSSSQVLLPSPSPPNPAEDEEGERGEEVEEEDADPPSHGLQPQHPPPRHPLLTPTLHQVSRSRHTTTAFIPTVSHLRAYLSVVFSNPATTSTTATSKPPAAAAAAEQQSPPAPLFCVYGLVELHRGTSEWSAQGLGSTCAALVEAGERGGRRVVLVGERGRRRGRGRGGRGEEEGESESGGGRREDGGGGGDAVDVDDDDGGEEEDGGGEEDGDNDDNNEGDGWRTEKAIGGVRESDAKGIWHEKLPILSGSVRRAGAEVEYGGRTVEVGMVLRRWFRFGRGEWGEW